MSQYRNSFCLALAGFLTLSAVLSTTGCSSSTSSTPTTQSPATNTVFFDSLYTNVTVTSSIAGTPWTIGTTLPGLPTKPVNFRFAAKPTANGTYTLVTQDPGTLTATQCMFFVNYLDGVNATTYFPTTANTKTATVTIVNGKVNVVVENVPVAGNRGGKDVQPVSANLREN
jgi:hypothetical protein